MFGMIRSAALLAALLLLTSATVHADRRYFVQSYTPYLAPAGSLELEVISRALSGQGDSTGTAWANRFEFEYGITDRLTGALYLNFIQPTGAEAGMVYDGPSLELIYRPTDPGKYFVDPAGYVEVRANGSELELEPKLLLGRRVHQLVCVANVIGEFEWHLNGDEKGETEKNMQLTLGASRELGKVAAIGFEGIYSHSFLEEGTNPSAIQFGPTLNLQTPKIQVALGWHPQISGSPTSKGGLNLADFPRSEVKLIIGVSL